jgi:hypothetical protein
MSKHHGSPCDPSSRSAVSPSSPSRVSRVLTLPLVSSLRRLLPAAVVAAGVVFAAGAAQAAVEITIDKNNQQMTVAVDGVQRYAWPVSTGVPSHETPNGTFRAFRMEADHFSKEWDDAPMPHSIFFTKIGHAIHGTDSVGRLGSPASHGCVRLSRDHAATLYDLVEKQGVLNTTVTLTGSSEVALARGNRNTQVARGDAGEPTQLAPRTNDPSAYGYAQQPGYAQPGYAAPAPGYPQQGYTQPGSAQQGYAQQSAANQGDDVTYFDRYGRPLDVYVTADGRRVYRLRRQQAQQPQPQQQPYAQADAYSRPGYAPRGFFNQ